MAEPDDTLPDYPDFLSPYLEQIRAKIPANWRAGAARKGGGWRWTDPDNPNNQVRIDPGRSEVSMPSQQIDHVVVNDNGVIIGRNGERLPEGIKSDPEKAHILLTEWLMWDTWYMPEESE